MTKQQILHRIEKEYPFVPMADITDEARMVAVRWVNGFKPVGDINIESKHKLASDIMNYAAHDSKGFVEWLHEMTTVVQEEKITLYRYLDKFNQWGNYTLDDIYLEYQEHRKHDTT